MRLRFSARESNSSPEPFSGTRRVKSPAIISPLVRLIEERPGLHVYELHNLPEKIEIAKPSDGGNAASAVTTAIKTTEDGHRYLTVQRRRLAHATPV